MLIVNPCPSRCFVKEMCVLLLLGACSSEEPDTTQQDPIHMTLESALMPSSGEVIDCFGGSISAAVPPGDSGLSEPDTLIFLDGVQGVQIRNCTLEATFPLVLFNADDNTIDSNIVRSSSIGVLLVDSSSNLVTGNDMQSAGRSVSIQADSDNNRVEGNTMSFSGGPAATGLPGRASSAEPRGIGITVSAYPGVVTLIVNDEVRQALLYAATSPDETQVLGNTIVNPGGYAGILFSTRSSNSVASGNSVEGGEIGLGVAGYLDSTEFTEPGTCTDDQSVACGGAQPDLVCSSLGAGSCEGTETITGGARVVAPTFSANRVEDATVGVSVLYAQDHTVEANDLDQTCIGIELFSYGLESGSVYGNTVQSDRQCEQYVTGGVIGTTNIGLKIGHVGGEEPSAFGVEIGFNDLGDTELPITLWYYREGEGNVPFGFAATLQGNWYGDAPCGLPAEPSWWPDVTDPTARAARIAEAWRQSEADAVAQCQ